MADAWVMGRAASAAAPARARALLSSVGVARELSRLPYNQEQFAPSRAAQLLGGFYILLVLLILWQLSRIAYHRHSMLSFQCAFLAMCMGWAAVRALVLMQPLEPSFLAFTLEWMPATFEFASFALLVMFCSYLLERESWSTRRTIWTVCYVLAVLMMFASIVALSYVVPMYGLRDSIRVHLGITGVVFGSLAVVIGSCHRKMKRMLQNETLQPLFAVGMNRKRHHTVERMVVVTGILVFVCSTRALCDLSAVGLYRWGFMDESRSMISFHRRPVLVFTSLLLWEIVPVLILIALFWEIPKQQSSHEDMGRFEPQLPVTDDTTATRQASSLLGSAPVVFGSSQRSCRDIRISFPSSLPQNQLYGSTSNVDHGHRFAPGPPKSYQPQSQALLMSQDESSVHGNLSELSRFYGKQQGS